MSSTRPILTPPRTVDYFANTVLEENHVEES